ncbi:GlcG/HbpS family heme-binding protein [Rathayibacter soli]|uniref:GlcG/HbpS family heme-binding protein n=1 Tax=Rathayibacter soli TaxID=3144168 RepID=UPI0027E3E940|nr:heme-binding protein [Glaciibacter superstes]
MTLAITLSIALELIAAAHQEAARRDTAISAAIVDAGGNLIAFGRMDGAEIAGATLATDKAFTAVAHSIPTEELGVLAAPGGELFGLQANGGGRYVIFGGGIPLLRERHIVGGVGVSGSTSKNDVACAEQAVLRFAELVPRQPPSR